MQPPGIKFRRRLGWLGAGLLLGLLGMFLLRGPLTRAALTAGLERAGAGDIAMQVAHSTPWLVQLENLAFKIKAQPYSASRVTMARAHWWQPTLGVLRIEGAKVPVTIDGSDANPNDWASYAGEPPASGGGFQVPVEKLSIDGQLVVRVTGHEQPLDLKFTAEPGEKGTWNGALQASGPGLALKAEATYGLGNQELTFRSTMLSVELKPWQDVIQQLVVMPLGPWTIEGKVTGDFHGSYRQKKFALDGRIELQDGAVQNSDGKIAVTGVEGEFEFTDLVRLQSNPGFLRMRELRTGKIVGTNLDAEIAFLDPDNLAVSRLKLEILGGKLAAEPFKLRLDQHEIEAVVLAENLDVEQILALSKDVPANGSGRVDGRLPIRLDEHGLRLGTGWLQLKKGVYAEVQLKAEGLITGGMSPKSSGYVVMKRVESGLLRLKLGALRLDVRPPDAQRGQTARLHLEGEPVDPSVKAPVTLDVNVNGPLEELLNFGLKDNISFGTGK